MRIEILCTGNELLDGSVVDSNSAWLESKLFERGLEVTEKRVVPDVLETITAAIREIVARADWLICSGGLGPTPDDLTAEALARAAGVPLVEDAGTKAAIVARLAERGREYTEAQARQAQVPQGAEVLLNKFGTAPHIQMKVGRCRVVLLPGVPREFFGLAEQYLLPRVTPPLTPPPGGEGNLDSQGATNVGRTPPSPFRGGDGGEVSSNRRAFAFLEIRCYGVWEADMAWAVRELPQRVPGVRVGTRTAAPENHLKLRFSGGTVAEAEAHRETGRALIRERLGDRVFTEDARSLPQVTFEALRDAHATVALAESCTGGLVAALLTDWPGSSEVLRCGWVVYTEDAKREQLGVPAELIARNGAVSQEVAASLAERARAKVGTTFGGGVTGWAGPSGGDAKNPVGTVYVALASARGVEVERLQFPGVERDRVRRGAAYALLNRLRLEAGKG